jgi:hypothetical protein
MHEDDIHVLCLRSPREFQRKDHGVIQWTNHRFMIIHENGHCTHGTSLRKYGTDIHPLGALETSRAKLAIRNNAQGVTKSGIFSHVLHTAFYNNTTGELEYETYLVCASPPPPSSFTSYAHVICHAQHGWILVI